MIRFSKHSLLKLEQRKISKNFVFATLQKPDYTKQSHGGRIIVFRKFKKMHLKVIFSEKFGSITIITQYWVNKIEI
jgi:hypothetical protein